MVRLASRQTTSLAGWIAEALNCSLLARGKISTTNNRVYNLSPFVTTMRLCHEINSPSWYSIRGTFGNLWGLKKLSWGRHLCCLRRYIMSRKIGRPDPVSGKFKTHVNGYSLLLLVMACFRNKTSSPLFLVDESAEKMQSFIPLKIPSAVVWQLWLLDWSFLSIQTENSGYWFPRTECVRNVAWWKFLVDFFPFKYV